MNPHLWRQVSAHAYVRHYDYLKLNVGVILGESGGILVDTGWSQIQAMEIRAEVFHQFGRPVVGSINTHAHFDHAWGNIEFTDRPIWGHEGCRRDMIRRGEDHRKFILTLVPDALVAEIKEVELEPPNTVFDRRMQIFLDSIQIDLTYYGKGHTDHDIVVEVKNEGVAFVGDLIEECGPPVFLDSYPISWPNTVMMAEQAMLGVVIPGHGAPTDKRLVDTQIAELTNLAQLIQEVRAGHRTSEDVRLLGPYKPETMDVALERGLAELVNQTE